MPTNHTKVLNSNHTLLKMFKDGGIFDYFRPKTKKMAGENQNTSKSVSFRPEILARSE